MRLYRPEQGLSGAGLLWIHGGGMITGNAATNDRECAAFARELGIVVVSVEYRLAPKHPFPAALDDCHAAWQWMLSAAGELGIDPARIAISGQSAGGGLAASLALRIRDAGGLQPAAQALMCPMLDDRTGARRELDAIDHRVWNNRSNRAAWSWYLGLPPGSSEVPAHAAAARCANLRGLPPAWIGVGEVDLFLEEDRRYARAADRSAGPLRAAHRADGAARLRSTGAGGLGDARILPVVLCVPARKSRLRRAQRRRR